MQVEENTSNTPLDFLVCWFIVTFGAPRLLCVASHCRTWPMSCRFGSIYSVAFSFASENLMDGDDDVVDAHLHPSS